jgi:PhzF family phenazine biosynthesis protein
MKINIFQLDAFTQERFSGNPAAVCVLDQWLDAGTMQQIASENNLAETAFVVKMEELYHIRWFTPSGGGQMSINYLRDAKIIFSTSHIQKEFLSRL